MGSHYSFGQNAAELERWTVNAVDGLTEMIACTDPRLRPVFCYMGMSGTAYATALMLDWSRTKTPECGMIYVRKSEEESHGNELEMSLDCVRYVPDVILLPVFVDDFVASGETRHLTMLQSGRTLKRTGFPTHVSSVSLTGKSISEPGEVALRLFDPVTDTWPRPPLVPILPALVAAPTTPDALLVSELFEDKPQISAA